MFKDLFSLKGRVALVTGGSRGIGKMIAAGFLAQGAARVYITARKAGPCEATAKELTAQYDGECIALGIDISTVEGCEKLASEIIKREPKLDILVNNAGAAWGADFDEFPESGWDKVMDLNVKSLFFLTKALAKPLRAAASRERPAKVINIASVDGIFVNPQETYSYAASKAAVIHLTRRMATKLIKDSINVTAIAPGAFSSDMNRAARDHGDEVAKRIPAQRIGTDEDMAGVAIYLASRAGDYVVGNTIAVDGGVVYANAGLPVAGWVGETADTNPVSRIGERRSEWNIIAPATPIPLAQRTAIVQAVIGMARSLGMTTTAKGVEDEASLAWLRLHGCTLAQGFLFARPMRVEQVGGFLTRSSRELQAGRTRPAA